MDRRWKRFAAAALAAGRLAWCGGPGATAVADGAVDIVDPCIISAPGSYVVTRNILMLGGEAISVEANDVDLDLNGHVVAGGTTMSKHGGAIRQTASFRNLRVRNGTVSGGWGAGITAAGAGAWIEDVTVVGAGGGAIFAGDDATVVGCTIGSNPMDSTAVNLVQVGNRSRVSRCEISGNSGSLALRGVRTGTGALVESTVVGDNSSSGYFCGISVEYGSIVRSCIVRNNTGAGGYSYGIQGSADANVSACVVSRNRLTGTGPIYGISVGSGSRIAESAVQTTTAAAGAAYGFYMTRNGVIECCASRNNAGATGYGFFLSTNVNLTCCTAWGNGSTGFFAQDGCLLKHCVAKYNGVTGYTLGTWCSIEYCIADNNGTGSTRTGIRVNGNCNRIENNNVSDSYYGIGVVGTGNFLAGNSASYNATANYSIAAGNSYGAILTAPGADFTTSNPRVNFAHH